VNSYVSQLQVVSLYRMHGALHHHIVILFYHGKIKTFTRLQTEIQTYHIL